MKSFQRLMLFLVFVMSLLGSLHAKEGAFDLLASPNLVKFTGDFESLAADELEKLAKGGNDKATLALGNRYFRVRAGEWSVEEQDFRSALKWYSLAAEHGLPEAQLALGQLYSSGNVAEESRNKKLAMQWIAKAANQGSADASFLLSLDYQLMQGEDRKHAVYWMKKAFEQGHDNAAHILGVMYEEGSVVGRDYGQAAYWYHQSISNNALFSHMSCDKLANMYSQGSGVAQNEKTAKKWRREAAKRREIAKKKISEKLSPSVE